MTSAALGLRAHSGWAVLVAVAPPLHAPVVLDRRRIELMDPRVPGFPQPYHAAKNLPFAKAKALIDRCEAGARQVARQSLVEALDFLRVKDFTVASCGLLLASGRPLPALAQVLQSHALIHTAEGALFREALAEAARHAGLRLITAKERDVAALAAEKLAVAPEALTQHVNSLGRALGPPWRQDHKAATLAAWIALAAE
jgi:hypothetical protein